MLQAPPTDSRFRVSEEQAQSLASKFGTPLYVMDERHFRERIRRYKAAFEAVSPGSEISFASKANSALALLAIASAEGCNIDVASEGEFRAALAAGVPAAKCHFHGNAKTRAEIEFALANGIGQIIVDNFEEIDLLGELQTNTPLLLRLAPGVDPVTHAKISTGQADTKFGFNIADGSAESAVARCQAVGLNLIGIHCHVGSQLLDPEAQRAGGEALGNFAVDMNVRHSLETKILNVGGGLGVHYTDQDEPMPVEQYCALVVQAISAALEGFECKPKLAQEPGRSLVAESGITLYKVQVVKTVPTKEGKRTYVSVDGGLSDNPRPVMYDSAYTVERVDGAKGDRVVTVSGKHCETDALFRDVPLPSDVKTGDLLQVLCTGAYNASMANTYNRYPRPAMALIRMNGVAELIQERDSWEAMFARERVPEDLKN